MQHLIYNLLYRFATHVDTCGMKWMNAIRDERVLIRRQGRLAEFRAQRSTFLKFHNVQNWRDNRNNPTIPLLPVAVVTRTAEEEEEHQDLIRRQSHPLYHTLPPDKY